MRKRKTDSQTEKLDNPNHWWFPAALVTFFGGTWLSEQFLPGPTLLWAFLIMVLSTWLLRKVARCRHCGAVIPELRFNDEDQTEWCPENCDKCGKRYDEPED